MELTFARRLAAVCVGLSLAPFVCTPALAATTKLNVKFSGVSGDTLQNVRQSLYEDAKRLKNHMTDKRVQEFIKRAPDDIKQATAPFGYFQPTTKVTVKYQNSNWQIQFAIKLGRAVKLRKVNLVISGPGKNTQPFLKYLKKEHNKLKIGDNFNSEKFSNAKSQLYDIAAEYGYFDAKTTYSKALIDLNNNSAEINIKFNTGRRFKFGKTTFSPSYLAPSFLHRYLNYKPGQHFRNTKLQSIQEQLNNSKYFNLATVNADFDKSKNGTIPVSIHLIDANRFKYIFGGGYGTDTGIRAIVGADVRMVNHYGHSFSAQTEVSKNTNFINLRYNIPGKRPGLETYTLHTLAGREDYSKSIGTAKLIETGVSYSRIIDSWTQVLDLSALVEQYKLKNYPNSRTITILPGIKLKKRVAKPRLQANNGYNISAELSGSPFSISGYSKFIQPRIKVKTLTTIGRDSRLILRGNLILTFIRKLTDLPLSLRPMAGGSQSIRGFAYNSKYNGKDLLVGSVEWQQRLYKSLYIAAFYDIGTVSDGLNGIYYQGAGPGLVWVTKIGDFSFTFAKQINPKGSWLFQFNIGPEV